ncbi:MAG: lipid A deacylase LpxR family protein [Chitinophagaceae bacterium]
MKALLLFMSCVCLQAIIIGRAWGQEQQASTLLRIFEDNDFLNYRGCGTDNAYTNGTKFDFFYERKRNKSGRLNSLLPTPGNNVVNVNSIGIAQLMFTPNNISARNMQYKDYPYAGALIFSRGFYSSNPVKKIGFQTELLLGVRGAASGARQIQSFIHHLIGYQQPMGWNNELPGKLLANINFTVEKQVIGFGKNAEIILGGQAQAGTYQNSITIYPMIRLGKLNRYFSGIISQYSSTKDKHRTQAYFIIKPEIKWQLSNALVQPNCKPFQGRKLNARGPLADSLHLSELSPLVYAINLGFVIVHRHIGFSLNQNASTALLSGTYNHEVGNISIYLSW